MSIEVSGIPAAVGDGAAAPPRRRALTGRGGRARDGKVGLRRARGDRRASRRHAGHAGRPALSLVVGREPPRPGARRARPPDRRRAAPARVRGERRRATAAPVAAGAGRRAAAARSAGPRRADPVREGPAAGHLRRVRGGQIVAAVHDRPGHRGGGVGGGPDRRARPRGGRVHRARPRPRGAGPLGRRRRHLGRAGDGPDPGGVHRHPDRRVVPRPG